MEDSDEAPSDAMRMARRRLSIRRALQTTRAERLALSSSANVRNQATADDLLLEVWCALARNTASLESTTRLRTRLFTLAHDRMSQWIDAQGAEASPEATAAGPAAARDPAGALAQAIGQLPREQREAYLLQIEGQLSVGEIAEIADTTIDAAQGHLRQARLNLRELLSDKT